MSWPRCTHGYNITPSHKCPWCFDGDTSKFRLHVGKGNGWLLGVDDYACEGCGGPRSAGWGAWAAPYPPTPENVREAISTIKYCYTCTSDGKAMRRTSKQGEALTTDEQKVFNGGACPDCGKRFIAIVTETKQATCPRLQCGSRFENYTRTSKAAPDAPPPKKVSIDL